MPWDQGARDDSPQESMDTIQASLLHFNGFNANPHSLHRDLGRGLSSQSD